MNARMNGWKEGWRDGWINEWIYICLGIMNVRFLTVTTMVNVRLECVSVPVDIQDYFANKVNSSYNSKDCIKVSLINETMTKTVWKMWSTATICAIYLLCGFIPCTWKMSKKQELSQSFYAFEQGVKWNILNLLNILDILRKINEKRNTKRFIYLFMKRNIIKVGKKIIFLWTA